MERMTHAGGKGAEKITSVPSSTVCLAFHTHFTLAFACLKNAKNKIQLDREVLRTPFFGLCKSALGFAIIINLIAGDSNCKL